MIKEFGKYYLYRHVRLDKNQVFYIGIGTIKNTKSFGITRYERSYSKLRNKIWKDITNKTKFEIEILFETDDYKFLEEKEKEFIKLYGRINNNTGILANLTDGGLGNYGTVCPDSKRKKISKINKGRKSSKKGSKLSDNQKLQISKTLTGRKLSKVSIEKRQKTKLERSIERGYYHSETTIINMRSSSQKKKVNQYSLEGNFIKEWESCHEAGKGLNISYKGISATCLGNRNKYKNSIWKYL